MVGCTRGAVNARCGRAHRKRQNDIDIERRDIHRVIMQKIEL